MLRFRCDRCRSELDAPGAILLSPRDSKDCAVKKHYCARCHGLVFKTVATCERCPSEKRGAILLSPPDGDGRVLVTLICVSHYQTALKAVATSLGVR